MRLFQTFSGSSQLPVSMLRTTRFDFGEEGGSEGWMLLPLLHGPTGCLELPPAKARVECFMKSPQDAMHVAFGGCITPEGTAWLNASECEGAIVAHSWNVSPEHCFCTDFHRVVETAGGDLDFSFGSGKKLRLHLVLSAKPPTWPDEFVTGISQSPDVRSARLEDALFERFGTRTESWIRDAIVAYHQFMDLQAAALKDGVPGYSPSPQIDAVWHVHLSLLDQYAEDCTDRYGIVIPHRVVASLSQSRAAYDRAFEAVFKTRGTVSTEFWPLPEAKRLRTEISVKTEYSCEEDDASDGVFCG